MDQQSAFPARPEAAVSAKNAGVPLAALRHPEAIAGDQLRALEPMYERMAKAVEGWFVASLRSDVEVTLEGLEQSSFGDFTMSLPSPSASFIYDIRDSGGQYGVIDLGLDLAFYVVDRLCGGRGDPVRLERGLSMIEQKVSRLVAERVALMLTDTWREYIPFQVAITGFQSEPETLKAANSEDSVLVTSFEVKAGKVTSLIRISVPFAPVEELFRREEKHAAGSLKMRAAASGITEPFLEETRIRLSARLPDFRLSTSEISALQAGSVISIGHLLTSEIELWIGGEPRFKALPGRIGDGHPLALQILQPLARPDARSEEEVNHD